MTGRAGGCPGGGCGGPGSRKSQNVSGLFQVPQFPLYLRNAAVLSHVISYSPRFFLHYKHVKISPFKNRQMSV